MIQGKSLKDLVVGYCEQVGGIVEGPAYGVYEVLLPDDVAARLRIAPHQKFVFSSKDEIPLEGQSHDGEGLITLLHYGHPLVEIVVDELRSQNPNGLFFINNVRLEKPGLYSVIEKTLQFPNAKLFPVNGSMERRRLYHFVRFNFKASLIADEKRELILPVWMHLQGGYAIRGDEIQHLAVLDIENQFPNLDPAEPQWLPNPPTQPISERVLRPLLERACQAVQHELGGTLENLQVRLKRFRELDVARLQQYYDDLKADVLKRLQKADETRRPALEAKLTAIESENRFKLEDVAQKYHLRVELELLNMAVIAYPKLELLVEVKKRTTNTRRLAVWDGLRHTVEPFVCDVCGQPGDTLYLCEQGHLAHSTCMAPQCVECKRTFCQTCSESVQACAVCDRPVCVHSLVHCQDCQRVTCHEHIDLCHAMNGEPERFQPVGSGHLTTEADSLETSSPPLTKQTTTTIQNTPRKQISPKARTSTKKTKAIRSSLPTTARIEVYSDPALNRITAYVFVKKRQLAARFWELTESGISVSCFCEKEQRCRAHGYIHRPAGPEGIEAQMANFLYLLRIEYQVLEKKIRYYHIRQEQAFVERKLKLPTRWKDPEVLAQAIEGFTQLR